MKKLITIFIFLTIFCHKDIYSQSDWFWLDPLPTGATLNGVDFADRNTGYTCGKTGVITKTTNGGLNWVLMNPVTVYELKSIECLDQNTCIAVGANGSIFKTTNGAESWVSIPSGVSSLLYDIDFPSEGVGYISGNNGTLLKTTNGGSNWTIVSLGISSTLFSISFIDDLKGAMGGQNTIYTTTNGGLNWSSQTFGGPFDYFQSVDYINDTTIYGLFIDFPYKVYKSTNSGVNWNSYDIEILDISELPRWISFTNSATGYIVTKDGNIGKTTNGGFNWTLDTGFVNESSFSQVFWKVNAIDTSNVYAVGAGGIVVRSTNSGGIWEKQVGNIKTYKDTYFTDVSTGYIVGEKGIVKKTTDGGLSWSNININTNFNLNKIFFTSSTTGFICGDSGVIRKTTNAGLNWVSQFTPSADSNLLSMHFVNESTGYIGVFPWSILKTVNAGSNWSRIYTNSQKDIAYYYDIDFWGSEHGVVAGDLGVLLTSNSGISWNKVIIPSSNFNTINYLDSSNIIGFGSSDGILKSTDAGNSWFEINNQFGAHIFSSQFFGSQYGVICGDLGRVAKTTNGGLNWIHQEFLASEFLYSVYFANPNTGYVVGQVGQIIKTTNGGLSLINSNSEIIPENYVLYQNYPNPFNPRTTIDYELGKPGIIDIKVYDASGKYRKTLVNKFHSAGRFSLVMDAAGFPSGVYFYTLCSNNFLIDTKKLLFIK